MPNVSYCENNNEVHYNPIVPPQPIAPVGKVQVFANPQCTEYADGQSNEVWVRLNQDFGFGEGMEWGNFSHTETSCVILTPDIEDPQNPYEITLWVDYGSTDRDDTIPFVNGEIIKCTCNPLYFEPIDNPQVIFE